MKRIELTELEAKVLEQSATGEFSEFSATAEEISAMVSVINKAEALMDELDAYDELDDSLINWYFSKYKAQETATTEE